MHATIYDHHNPRAQAVDHNGCCWIKITTDGSQLTIFFPEKVSAEEIQAFAVEFNRLQGLK